MDNAKFIVGYDVRTSIQESLKNWNNERKIQYLYKEDVLIPLSTDSDVWGKAFEMQPEELFFIGHQMLWTNLQELKLYLNQRTDLSPDDYMITAIEIVLDEKEQNEILKWQEITKSVIPSSADSRWSFIGYDISDKWLLSGLSNCGFISSQDDVFSLKEKWKPYLNQYHLFDDIKKAFEFKALADRRILEHSPFFVFGLWQIE